MDRYKLADLIAFADLGRGGLPGVFQVLGRQADRSKRKDVSIITNGRLPVDDDMRVETNAVAQNNLSTDHRERADMTAVADARAGVNDCSLVYECRHRELGIDRRVGRSGCAIYGRHAFSLRGPQNQPDKKKSDRKGKQNPCQCSQDDRQYKTVESICSILQFKSDEQREKPEKHAQNGVEDDDVQNHTVVCDPHVFHYLLLWPVRNDTHYLGLGRYLSVNRRHATHLLNSASDPESGHFEHQRISGNDRATKAGRFDSAEE